VKRRQYLMEEWLSYPESQKDALYRGRLISKVVSETAVKSTSVTVELTLEQNFVPVTVHVQKSPLVKILLNGDLIEILSMSGRRKTLGGKTQAVTEKSGLFEVVLLAPNLRDQKSCRTSSITGPLGAAEMLERVIRLKQWNLFVSHLRDFFVKNDFLEISTPSLVVCPGTEPSLEVYKTTHLDGSRSRPLYLPTSPELHLKRALGFGFEKIFEITRSYRNNEVTDRHQPEFWILEWYRAFSGPAIVERDVQELIFALSNQLPGARRPLQVVRKTVTQLFAETFHFEFRPNTSENELRELAQREGIDVHAATSIDDLFFLLFYEIEQKMNPDDLLFVVGYPPYQAALARIDEQGWAERFEVYWQGLELANAFHELNDPVVQRNRSQQDLMKKEIASKEKVPLDEEFFEALEAGIPPASGIALGIERLFMAFYDIRRIQDVRLFPMGQK
jgi:lysyl-tRNA synthetase class 2